MCKECYIDEKRTTPLLRPLDCLKQHTQYICGTCGRCICIEKEPKRGLQRWNFPFRTAEIAKMYLRTADATVKKVCGIYEIKNENGRCSYKIFESNEELRSYLRKNKGKSCNGEEPVFSAGEYREYQGTEIRMLTPSEMETYMAERAEEEGCKA